MRRATLNLQGNSLGLGVSWALAALTAGALAACGGSNATNSGTPGADAASDTTTDGTSLTDAANETPLTETGVTDAASEAAADAPVSCIPAPVAPTACLSVPEGGVPAYDAGSDDGGGEAATGEAGATDAAPVIGPTGAVSTVYPAFQIDAPQLTTYGGTILTSPVFVPITWTSDPDASKMEDFVDKIGPSAFWNRVTCEYGVGPGWSDACNHVHITTPLTTVTDIDLDTLVSNSTNNPASSGWPAPTAETVYILFLPPSATAGFTLEGQNACDSGIGGYHTNASANGVTYAVVPRCTAFFGDSDVNSATAAASHELAEAATDPNGQNPAYYGFDDDHVIWWFFQEGQVEIGDNCELYDDSFGDSAELGYGVQRLWSNASIATGHAPCVPIPAGTTYFNVTPLDLYPVVLNVPADNLINVEAQPVNTRGINIPPGQTGSFQVGYYSDGPLDADWRLTAVEGGLPGSRMDGTAAAAYASGNLALSVDHPTGRNGDIATITVTVKEADPTLGGNMVRLVSKDASGTEHYFPVLITSN